MMSPPETRARLFTVEQANAMLPLIRAITGDLVRLARDVVDRRQRLDHLIAGRDAEEGDPYSQELAQVELELQKDYARLREFAQELEDLGVELKGAAEGLVDFPAMMDGRLAYLCWKYDEPEVGHWHELDEGYSQRQALTADVGGESADL